MAGLSDIFGGDNGNSSNDQGNETGTVADLNSTLGLDATNSNEQSSTDEDGNSSSSSSDQTFGLDTSTDGLLHSVTDSFSSSDSADS